MPHLAMIFAANFVLQANGHAISFHSFTKADNRSDKDFLSAKINYFQAVFVSKSQSTASPDSSMNSEPADAQTQIADASTAYPSGEAHGPKRAAT
jgi:hypothetical protein